MKKLLLKLSFLTFFVLLQVIIVFLLPGNSKGYFAANLDKLKLLQETSSPKIVFIGGSNLAFALDSRAVEDGLQQKVVNMGLHAAFSIRTMFNEIRPYINSGDTVVVVMEHGKYYNPNDSVAAALMIDVDPSFIKNIPIDSWGNILNQIPVIFESKIRVLRGQISKEPIYYRSAFNSYGDIISPLIYPRKSLPDLNLRLQKGIDTKNVNALFDFQSFALHRGARMLIAFSPIPKTTYQHNQKEIDYLYEKLIGLGFKVINTPESQIYADEEFYDTVDHLNAAGKYKNTIKMISNLSNYFKNQQ